jgi:SAM-dependent methyltransferase
VSDDEFVDQAGDLVDRIERMQGDDRIAAACRGSANPAALGWLADTLEIGAADLVADLGAGLGGPAAWMRSRVGCAVVAADPSPTAVDGARRLFGLLAAQSTASPAPFRDGAFDAVLLLGVLSVVEDRVAVLREAARVGRRVGVLDYCSTTAQECAVGGSRFAPAAVLAEEMALVWPQVRWQPVREPTPDSWQRAAERAHAGVPQPASEREVADAIETGRLAPHALVGR